MTLLLAPLMTAALRRPPAVFALLLAVSGAQFGCSSVIAVADAAITVGATAVSVGATAVGVATDVVVGTAKVGAKVVGKAVDAATDK